MKMKKFTNWLTRFWTPTSEGSVSIFISCVQSLELSLPWVVLRNVFQENDVEDVDLAPSANNQGFEFDPSAPMPEEGFKF